MDIDRLKTLLPHDLDAREEDSEWGNMLRSGIRFSQLQLFPDALTEEHVRDLIVHETAKAMIEWVELNDPRKLENKFKEWQHESYNSNPATGTTT